MPEVASYADALWDCHAIFLPHTVHIRERLHDEPKEHVDAQVMLHSLRISLLVHVCNVEWTTDVFLLILCKSKNVWFLCKRKNVWFKFNL